MMKKLFVTFLPAALVLAGCREGGGSSAWTWGRSAPAPAAKQSGTPEANGSAGIEAWSTEVVAYVNGLPIARSELYRLLVLSNGPKMARHLVACAVVDQEAARRGVTVTEADIRAEDDMTQLDMFPDVHDAAQRQRLLEQLMARGNISREQWRMSMRRQALLGKMVSDGVVVSDEEMQAAFEQRYGKKLIVRHIQCASLGEAQQAMQRLSAGEDFATLARLMSKNGTADDGGLLPPVGKDAPFLPRALYNAAWAMTTPGQVSGPVQVGSTYHILYLESMEQPANVKPSDVRDELRAGVLYGKLRDRKAALLRELVRKSEIRWTDPALSGEGGVDADILERQ
jgi:foldase protein PrsA